jgi:hypothetical protein
MATYYRRRLAGEGREQAWPKRSSGVIRTHTAYLAQSFTLLCPGMQGTGLFYSAVLSYRIK